MAKAPRKSKSVSAPAGMTHEPRLSKFQGFKVERIARGQLSNAPYNPRSIDNATAKRLRESLKRNMLVEPLIWNRRTGNLVGGHQRINQLDALEKTADYSLDVAVIDVDEKKEREINLALNNPAIQGSFDVTLLGQMVNVPEFDFTAAGLTASDAAMMFPESSVLNSMFSAERAPEPVKRDLADLQELSEQERPKKKRQADETPDERVARMKREKKEHREKAAVRDDTEYYAVVTCEHREAREHLMEVLGLDVNERYVPLELLLERLDAARVEQAS